jgi:ammonium transporter Rh
MCAEIAVVKFKAADMGGSMVVHTFGAYFGIGASCVLTDSKLVDKWSKWEDGNYVSQLVAMVGTVFLWCYWPSFNGVLAGGNSQMRVICNTVLALTASCIAAFATSSHFHKGKFNMEDVLNATLAGGVIIGTTADMMIAPWQPIFVGFLGGMVSSMGFNGAFGFTFHDTCGVNNLHGIPGILGGIAGVVMTMVIDDPAAASIFWAMDPVNDDGREKGTQAMMQFACLVTVFVVSLFSGMIAGSVAKGMTYPSPFFHDDYHFDADEAALPVEKKEKKEKKAFVKKNAK